MVRPGLGLPAVVRPGDRLTILIGSVEPPAPAQCRVSLCRYGLRYSASVEHISKVPSSPGAWLIDTVVPIGATCPLLYDVRVNLAGHGLEQFNAAMVVPRFSDDMTCVQITDLEINDKDPGPGERLARAIREINLIAPDFVLATGDLTYDGRPRQFDLLVERLRGLEVPVYTVIGNADHHGDESAYFHRLNAYRDYSVDVGPVHLTALDSGTNYKISPGAYNFVTDNQGTGLSDDQIAWFEKDLATSPADSLRLAFMHFPAVSQFGNRASIHFNRERFKTLCERHHVAMVFAGHTHVNSVFDSQERLLVSSRPAGDGPLYVQTATTSSRERAPIFPYCYRLVRIKRHQVVEFSYGGNPMAAVPVGQLDVRFDPPDDRDARRITATITNGLREAFDNARIIFEVAAKPGPDDRIEGGRLVCVLPDGPCWRVVVSTSIPAEGKRTVALVRR
jgi:predicted phosphodiesterase